MKWDKNSLILSVDLTNLLRREEQRHKKKVGGKVDQRKEYNSNSSKETTGNELT